MNQNAKNVAMSGTKRDKTVIPRENCCQRALASAHLQIPSVVWTGDQADTDHADKVHTPDGDGGEADGGHTE